MTAIERLESEHVEHSRLESQMYIAVMRRDERSAIALWHAVDASDRRIELLKQQIPLKAMGAAA